MSATSAALELGEALRPEPASARPIDPGELARFLRSALARETERALRAIVLPAPAGDGARLLEKLVRTDAFALSPQGGPEVVALGVAHREALSGEGRFLAAQRVIEELFGDLERIAHPDAPPVRPRAFCGFSFAPGGADRDPWTPFGDGQVLLPRWTYFGGERPALVCLVDRARQHAARAAQLESELEAILAGLAEAPPTTPRATVASIVAEAPELHAARVDAALAAIRRGEAQKLVVSRTVDVTTDGLFSAEAAYRALSRGARRGATAFLVRRGGAAFVGATPELLLSRRGETLRTMALAGTAAKGAADLRESAKDLAEHRVVVEAIVEALRPLARTLSVDEAPHVTSAGPMVHLRTSIEAELRAATPALAVASRLHPTPAVAGAPREVAQRFLSAHEPHRGWYAGPLGWVDSAGDAELVVALRCGLVRGGRAIAYAGGGIVEGSTAAAERAEADLKMRPFLEALGASTS